MLNNCDLVTEEEKEDVRRSVLQFNKMAIIIESSKSAQFDLNEILNTSMFVFNVAEANLKHLGTSDHLKSGSNDFEGSISSFSYRRVKPFNPMKIHQLLTNNFMVDIDDNNGDD